MKLALICFTLTGWETAEKLSGCLKQQGWEIELAKKSRYLPDSIAESTKEWAGMQFTSADGILFVGACGIAVRSIAPYVTSKKADPAVLVIDECGKYVISLLSGHLGGANDLARQAAAILGAIPVVTTATDLHDRFAVDVFAKANQCDIFPMTAAKEVSAALLDGQEVGFYSDFPWEGDLPRGLVLCNAQGVALPDKDTQAYRMPLPEKHGDTQNLKECRAVPAKGEKRSIGIAVTVRKDLRPFAITVYLVPKIIVLGMGCKKGKETESLLSAAKKALEDAGIFPEAVACVASIDLKKDEPGLLALAQKLRIPFVTFTEEALRNTPGEFTPSAFVRAITGVDNVCERSALCAAQNGRLIKRKTGANGVTTALAQKEWRILF